MGDSNLWVRVAALQLLITLHCNVGAPVAATIMQVVGMHRFQATKPQHATSPHAATAVLHLIILFCSALFCSVLFFVGSNWCCCAGATQKVGAGMGKISVVFDDDSEVVQAEALYLMLRLTTANASPSAGASASASTSTSTSTSASASAGFSAGASAGTSASASTSASTSAGSSESSGGDGNDDDGVVDVARKAPQLFAFEEGFAKMLRRMQVQWSV